MNKISMSNPKFSAVLLCVYNCFGFDNHTVENMSTGNTSSIHHFLLVLNQPVLIQKNKIYTRGQFANIE